MGYGLWVWSKPAQFLTSRNEKMFLFYSNFRSKLSFIEIYEGLFWEELRDEVPPPHSFDSAPGYMALNNLQPTELKHLHKPTSLHLKLHISS